METPEEIKPVVEKKKPTNGRQKGARGEREACQFLAEHSPHFQDARRSKQYCGYTGDAGDIVSKAFDKLGVHPEVKRVEAGNLYKWMAQAQRDADAAGAKPVVIHKRNGEDWVAILPLKDLVAIWNVLLETERTQNETREN